MTSMTSSISTLYRLIALRTEAGASEQLVGYFHRDTRTVYSAESMLLEHRDIVLRQGFGQLPAAERYVIIN